LLHYDYRSCMERLNGLVILTILVRTSTVELNLAQSNSFDIN